MNFNEALELMKQGKKVKRRKWENGVELYLKDNDFWFIRKDIIMPTGLPYNDISGIPYEDIVANDWEEYKVPLLTEEEKEYLKMIIKFSPGKVKYVTLGRYAGDCNYIHLNYATDCGVNPAHCVSKKFFKNLESHRMYKLKDLGLEE